MLKRLLDIFLSITALVFLFPIFIVVYFYVKFDSPGDVLFKQIRVGKNCNKFIILKYRSMYVNKVLVSQNPSDITKETFKVTALNDPRITKSGAFIRKYHLDELPQLVNVLKGDMSIVGPRPDTPFQESDYISSHWVRRHKVCPGVTGLAQLSQKNKRFSAGKRVALDLYYVKKNSLCFDLYLIIRTIKHVFLGSSF